MTWLLFAVPEPGSGVTFGVFGAGGSAFATPVLVLLGVPASDRDRVAAPRDAPRVARGAREYLRVGLLDRRVAKLAVLAGLPAVVAGAACLGLRRRVVAGRALRRDAPRRRRAHGLAHGSSRVGALRL